MALKVTPPLSSLVDSIVNPKVKTTEGGVGARSLTCNTWGVKGVPKLWDGTRKINK